MFYDFGIYQNKLFKYAVQTVIEHQFFLHFIERLSYITQIDTMMIYLSLLSELRIIYAFLI